MKWFKEKYSMEENHINIFAFFLLMVMAEEKPKEKEMNS